MEMISRQINVTTILIESLPFRIEELSIIECRMDRCQAISFTKLQLETTTNVAAAVSEESGELLKYSYNLSGGWRQLSSVFCCGIRSVDGQRLTVCESVGE